MFGFENSELSRQKEQSPIQMTKTTVLVALKTQNYLAVSTSEFVFERAQLAKSPLVLTQIAMIVNGFESNLSRQLFRDKSRLRLEFKTVSLKSISE